LGPRLDGGFGDAVKATAGEAPSLASAGMAVDTIRTLLEQAFPGGTVDVLDRTGGGDHFHVTVASPSFDGVSLVEQHRMVNRALAAPLADGTIHELRITTKGTETP
jgi:stress-induced morphogen